MKILAIFLLYCIICSCIATVKEWHAFHKADNEDKEKFDKELKEIAESLTCHCEGKWIFTREDVLIILYVLGSFFGFIILPVALLRKVFNLKKDKC